jgi:hypothetical protein
VALDISTGARPEVSKYVYQSGFFDPFAGPLPYKIPAEKVSRSDYMHGFVVACEKGDELNACLNRGFPGFASVSEGGNGFQLVAEGLRYHHCSESHVTNFHLHWLQAPREGENPILANFRDPLVPEEIIDWQVP